MQKFHLLIQIFFIFLWSSSAVNAETPFFDENGRVAERHRESLCGASISGEWERDIVKYITQNAKTEIYDAYANVTCDISLGLDRHYIGNMLHLSTRRNPHSQNVAVGLIRYLLKHNPSERKRALFVNLIRGQNLEHPIFYELRDTYENDIKRRRANFNTANYICLSIDRYNVTELQDIRNTDCLTEPFVIPFRN